MPLVIRVGYSHFLVKNQTAGAAIMRAIAGALELDTDYDTDPPCFYPRECPGGTSMQVVPADRILPGKRRKGQAYSPAAQKQINGNHQLLLGE